MDPKEPRQELTISGLLYDWYMDESARLAARTDWFLIAHAILLEAFLTARSGDTAVQIVVGSIGVATSFLWLAVGIRQRWLLAYWGRVTEIPELMGDEAAALFRAAYGTRNKGIPKGYAWAQPVPTFTVGLPLVFVLAWFLLTSVATKPWWKGFGTSLAVVAASAIVTWSAGRKGPRTIKQQLMEDLTKELARPKSSSSVSRLEEPTD